MTQLDRIKNALATGDVLALGELENALRGQPIPVIEGFGREIRPLLVGLGNEGMMTMAETIIAESVKRSRLLAVEGPMPRMKQHPFDATPIQNTIVEEHRKMMQLQPVNQRPRRRPPQFAFGTGKIQKTVITEPQKGQRRFVIDGREVWAGSLKAAIKKARKLRLRGEDPAKPYKGL